jgi:hypothetical protein
MTTEETGLPKLRYLGSYEPGVHNLVLPRALFEQPRVETALDRELAAAAKVAAAKANDQARVTNTRRARALQRLKHALHAAVFGRRISP